MKVWLSWHAYKVCWDFTGSEKMIWGAIFSLLLPWTCMAFFLSFFFSSAEQNQQKPQLLKEAVMLCALSNRDDKLLPTPRQ